MSIDPKNKNLPILFWDRKRKLEIQEAVYGDWAIRWVYKTRLGRVLMESVFSKVFVSKIYGFFQTSFLSRHKIKPFVKKFEIHLEEFEDRSYLNFNDFFTRKFRPDSRSFVQNQKALPAFAEGRYFAYEKIQLTQKFPIKGESLSASALLGGSDQSKPFVGGPLVICRLCPTDYHRFHFPDSGSIVQSYHLHGKLHSVNPVALQYKEDIFVTNERHVSILKTKNFGLLAYIEVGATFVGKIVQTYSDTQFARGDEKGYFLFGGSTVILMGQPGLWKPDADLLRQTSKGQETLVLLGEQIAAAT